MNVLRSLEGDRMPISDPNNSGRNQRMVPSEEEIADACHEIQDGWTSEMEQHRRNFKIECRSTKRGTKLTPRSGGKDRQYEFPDEHGG